MGLLIHCDCRQVCRHRQRERETKRKGETIDWTRRKRNTDGLDPEYRVRCRCIQLLHHSEERSIDRSIDRSNRQFLFYHSPTHSLTHSLTLSLAFDVTPHSVDSPVLRAANGIALITESIDYNTQSFSDFAMEWFRLDDPENNDFWNYLASKTVS